MRLVVLIGFVCSASLPRANAVCPRGLAGKNCAEQAWPACVKDGVAGDCRRTNTCECFAQCERDYFLGGSAEICYNVSTSSYAEMIAAQAIVYKRERALISGANDCPECEQRDYNMPAAAAAAASHRAYLLSRLLVNPSECPNGCSQRGFCFSGGHCECFQLVQLDGNASVGDMAEGVDCSGVSSPKRCFNDCNAHGTCDNGVCMCQDGYGGLACQPADPPKPDKKPYFFVYDLPPGFNVYQELVALDRNIGWHLTNAILADTHHLTRDPQLADYFVVPVFPMGSVSSGSLLLAIQYIQAQYPHWNNSRGYNHIAFGAYDSGLCTVSGHSFFDRIRMVSHFGFTTVLRTTYAACICPLCGPSYRPGIDVLVPDTMEYNFKNLGVADLDRKTHVFFSGGATGKWRSFLFQNYSNVLNWEITNGKVNLHEKMSTSIFCLDVGAAGFSTRFTLAVVLGCIPVYLDGLKQPWDSALPIQDFAVKVPIAMFESMRLAELINAVTPATIKRMQSSLRHYRKYFLWNFMSSVQHEHDAYFCFKQLLLSALLGESASRRSTAAPCSLVAAMADGGSEPPA